MSRRRRALIFGALAALCAIASASIASGYRDNVDRQLGELRPVLVSTTPLRSGVEMTGRVVRAATETREVPVRFLPPDAISDPASVRGSRLAAAVPAGSYLLASHLRRAGRITASTPRLGRGKHPVDILVVGAGSLAGGRGPSFVDVVVATEPITGGRAKVEVASEGVQLLGLEPAGPERASAAGEDAWLATLALGRAEALDLIEAENFARQIRIIPSATRGGR